MGEIIVRPVPPIPLSFTGERLTSDYGGQTQIEHFHRYLLAREWCRGKDVLDVASGEGYGTALLAQVASSAVGVELAVDAVEHANRAYEAKNLRFLTGDARALPNADATFDVVISFETIEHFAEQTQFLKEVRRVLRPGGLFIVSTPDRDNYSPAETPANPYHVRELTGAEFQTLLQTQFAEVSILLQRPMYGSVLLPAEASAAPPLCFERRGDKHFEGSVGLSRPQYLVAFASDSSTLDLPTSIYIDTGRLGMLSPPEAEERLRSLQGMLDAAAGRTRQTEGGQADFADLATLRTELIAARGEVKGLMTAIEMNEKAYGVSRAEFTRATRAAAEANERAALAEARIKAIFASTSWRVTAPVRAVSRKLLRRS